MESPGPAGQAFDVEAIRAVSDGHDRPGVSRPSSLAPLPVVEAMTECYLRYRANIHRGTYDLSIRASELFDQAVRTMAGFLQAMPDEIILTHNTTHSTNLVAHTVDSGHVRIIRICPGVHTH